MIPKSYVSMMTGFFILFAISCVILLAVKVSGLTTLFNHPGYTVTAKFDNVGNLKKMAPVKIAGVKIGEVSSISLDPVTFQAVVSIYIDSYYNKIPNDSTASILTDGLLGDNYISISPMYSNNNLSNGDTINRTTSAFILEQLVGRLLLKLNSN